MKKKVFNLLLMAAVVLGLSLCVASCKDDDDKNEGKTEEELALEEQQKADMFWDVVGQLTSMDNYTADYQDKTFEPTIGEPSEGNPYVRIVATNDMEAAAMRFANLTGADVNENTVSYEWKMLWAR